MQIVSINSKQTESDGHLAFNVDVLPTQEMLDLVKIARIKIFSKNGALHIQGYCGVVIEQSIIVNIIKEINMAEEQLKINKSKEQEIRIKKLGELSRSLNIGLD